MADYGRCVICGAVFERSKAGRGRYRRYCSSRCRQAAYRERRNEERRRRVARDGAGEEAASLQLAFLQDQDGDPTDVERWRNGAAWVLRRRSSRG